ncbi:MAG: hypothetical protein Q7O66_18555 [Dehalococcoidia bacterium]|nr:hypothetical protein [Dehalococcoidia bacterium]
MAATCREVHSVLNDTFRVASIVYDLDHVVTITAVEDAHCPVVLLDVPKMRIVETQHSTQQDLAYCFMRNQNYRLPGMGLRQVFHGRHGFGTGTIQRLTVWDVGEMGLLSHVAYSCEYLASTSSWVRPCQSPESKFNEPSRICAERPVASVIGPVVWIVRLRGPL